MYSKIFKTAEVYYPNRPLFSELFFHWLEFGNDFQEVENLFRVNPIFKNSPFYFLMNVKSLKT